MTCGYTDGLPPDLMPISLSRRLFGRLFIFLVLLCTPLFVLPTYAQSSVVIGEVQWAGSENSSADEWIELWNLGNTPFSLKNFHLRGAGSGTDLVFGSQDQISPQSAFLIANYHALDPKSTLTFDAQAVSTTLSLTNEQTAITLLDANGLVLDEVHWDKLAPGGSNVSPRSSMIRVLNGTFSIPLWTSATTSKNLLTTAHQFGGPGICEGCSMMPQANILDSDTATPFAEPATTTIQSSGGNLDPLQEDTVTTTVPAPNDSPTDLAQTLLDAGIDPSSLDTELTKEQQEETSSIETPVITLTPPLQDETLIPPSASSTLISTSTELQTKDIAPENPLTTSSSTLLEEPLPILDPLLEESSSTTSSTTTAQAADHETISDALTQVTSTHIEPTIQTPSPAPEAPVPVPILLPHLGTGAHFSEIYPSPVTGAEWIELKLDEALLPSDLSGWSIRDKNKTILTIRPATIFTWNVEQRLLVFSFANGKLPNKGTTLFLIDANGHTEDTVSVPVIEKKQSFAQTQDSSWKSTATPTPGTENRVTSLVSTTKTTIPKKAPVSPKTTTLKPALPPTIKKSTSTQRVAALGMQKVSKKNTSTLQEAALSSPLVTLKGQAPEKKKGSSSAAKTTKTIKKVVATKKKPSQKKVISEPQTIDLKNIGPMYASTRVRITGTVATLPRLLGNNTFVIQTDDGRGLYISGNSKQSSPPFHAHIALTGTLSVNDDGLILHMYASDRWKLLELERAVQPRVPDLDQPSLEDAWSYVQLKGIVSSVSPTRVVILHNGTEIAVSIRPVVHYRVERLKKGDEIEVSGILDTRKDSLTLFPRLADEIHILKSAPLTTSEAIPGTHTPLPWMPVGAAGMSIAVTQGARRYWKYRLEQKIRFSKPN